ncbi:Arm DNA-binding domain-containing protein [Acetobacter sp. P1H12_c]|uniref:Arm DNA-binding domain-containing protein n=1 Tax=Acetobacter sp. P1H12_c TaxID=2762621 RepID=UPI00207B15AE|nr:Arm DNA-binding domain-containing protein [Acetobacter sp. P1H12_c]
MDRLSATSVKATKEPGCYGDGDGLYLVVTPSGSKSWVCRVQKNGKRRDIGLGSVKKVPLSWASLEKSIRRRLHASCTDRLPKISVWVHIAMENGAIALDGI